MLDPAAPTRLFSSLPEGVQVERMGLVDAIEAVAGHLQDLSQREREGPAGEA
jgi:ATP-dependent DNA helicase DinG